MAASPLKCKYREGEKGSYQAELLPHILVSVIRSIKTSDFLIRVPFKLLNCFKESNGRKYAVRVGDQDCNLFTKFHAIFGQVVRSLLSVPCN
jgi:hypothetical protein